eukprot:830836-Rhodomonas_salina.1
MEVMEVGALSANSQHNFGHKGQNQKENQDLRLADLCGFRVSLHQASCPQFGTAKVSCNDLKPRQNQIPRQIRQIRQI